MAKYTPLNANEIEGLAGFFGIGEVGSLNLLEGGSNNTSYLLKTNNDIYVLSVCDGKSYEEVKSLSKLLGLLEEYGFPTTRVVRAIYGTKVAMHLGKPIFLKKFIEGKVCHDLTPSMLVKIGESIADLHQIPAPGYLPTSFPYGVDSFSDVTSSGLDPQFREWLGRKKSEITVAFNPGLPKGLVHGDIFYDNVLFSGNGLVAIIDFEEACNYYLIFDIGMCAVGTCIDERGMSLPKIKALVSGYQNERKLSDLEKISLQTFIQYGAVATSFWRFRQHHIINPDREKSDKFRTMFDLANEVISIPPAEFMNSVF